MADSSDTNLTKYTSAVTVVTADVMNRIFGGEYGSNTSVDEFHPLVAGHVHDGTHANGRASKILLTEGAHVRGQLAHANLGGYGGSTPAVQYINLQSYSDLVYGTPAARRAAAIAAGEDLENLAIPEYIENTTTGEKKYFLDLSGSAGGDNTNIQFNNAGAFGGNNGFVYDYTNTRVGIGISSPDRRLHIKDLVNPPLRVVGLSAGSGTAVVVDASGDFYTSSSVGVQNLFENIAVVADGGSASGGPVVADSVTDTVTFSAGTGITLTATADTDTVKIESSTTPSTPGGADTNIQYNDSGSFGGNSSFLYNKVAGGTGEGTGPIISLENTTNGPGDFDKYSAFNFIGNSGTLSSGPIARIAGFHHTYGGSANDYGNLYLQTYHDTDAALKTAIIIDGGKDSLDKAGYVGIGPITPGEVIGPDLLTAPARRIHIVERATGGESAPADHSPIRINDLKKGKGHITLWNSNPSESTAFPDSGDIYYLETGTPGQVVTADANRQPAWKTPSIATPTITETAADPYVVLATDDYVLATGTAQVITLLAGADHNTGVLTIKDKAGSAFASNITINTDGAETIDGAASLVLDADYASVMLAFSGTEWSIV
jgi:hypothetical protein